MQGKCFICAKLTNEGKILNPGESCIILKEVLGLPKTQAKNSLVKRFWNVCYCPGCLRRLLKIQIFKSTQVPGLEEALKNELKFLWQDLLTNCTNSKNGTKISPLGMLQLLRNEVVEEIRKCNREDLNEIFQNWEKSDHESVYNHGEISTLQSPSLNRETNEVYQKECPRDGAQMDVNGEPNFNGKAMQMSPLFEEEEEQLIDIVDFRSDSDQLGFEEGTQDDRTHQGSYDCPSSDSLCKPKTKKKKFTSTNQQKRKVRKNTRLQKKIVSESQLSNSYKCKGCGEIFSSRIDMQNHVSSLHGKNGRYACTKCEYIGKDIAYLRFHYLSHSNQKNYHCDKCNSSYRSRSGLFMHKKTHSSAGRFKCKLCSAVFNKITEASNHKRLEHPIPKTEWKFQCDECKALCQKKSDLARHKASHPLPGEPSFECVLCLAKFRSKSALAQHVGKARCVAVTKNNIPISGPKPKDNFTRSNECKSKKRRPCSSLQNIKISKSNPETSNSFECKGCGDFFSSQIKLNDHVVSLHRKNADGAYACTLCEYTTKDSITHLRSHYRRHSDQRNFHCDECESSFKEARTLHRHKKIHLRVGPFKCKYCPVEFDEIEEIRKHERREHPITSKARKFSCDECNACFRTNSHLNEHKKVHRGELDFKCIWCLAKFRTSNALRLHNQGEYCVGINEKAEN